METIEKAFNELVLNNPTWVKPCLRLMETPAFCKTHFIVDLVDFEEISSTPYVRIVYMRKRYTSLLGPMFSIFCQIAY